MVFEIRRFVSSHRIPFVRVNCGTESGCLGVNGAELATILIITELVLVIWLLVAAVYLDKLKQADGVE